MARPTLNKCWVTAFRYVRTVGDGAGHAKGLWAAPV